MVDKNRYVGEVFPSLRYDGGLTTSILSEKSDTPTKFAISELVIDQDNETYDTLEDTVMMLPTTKSKFYTIPKKIKQRFHPQLKQWLDICQHNIPTRTQAINAKVKRGIYTERRGMIPYLKTRIIILQALQVHTLEILQHLKIQLLLAEGIRTKIE